MYMFDTYEYRLQGRRPSTYAALGFGMAMTYVGTHSDASALAWALISVFLAMVLGVLLRNRAAGLRLERESLEVYEGGRRRRIALSGVLGAELGGWRFGARRCQLLLADGRRMMLPRSALPPPRRLAEELRQRGVPTRIVTAVRSNSQAATCERRVEPLHAAATPAAYSGSAR